ncbi:meiotic recombination protein SPO11-2, putative [Plasmodium knowlesi strain H]|uniref:DNA topoisomerase (ATP-hydrolyzing) n=2 Tax=Plasmodium knowlesi TaxID=5850 RepID=B3L238_PLAKH|nr:meiotic recombination protein SPO11-2, putative [Plasmodium knowlesi strain H]OTN68296.1 putative Topoisomerase [Plasmodium knowlesi]CAA9987170.1 meiotic recombination protein SPO11-2, putative [Plasmodium knowlesi strain H]VVS76644.1 meiotic recombination protein SPO11-2, putative [Plasmodium knowlesi strain H]|eukprot:XP_002261794.1 topoisomerase, putative [Plasmodium knowlesi strain H]
MGRHGVEKGRIFEEIEDFVLHVMSWLLSFDVDIFKANSEKQYPRCLLNRRLVGLCRTVSVVQLVNDMVIQDKSCTQRGIYYKLYNLFSEQCQANRHILHVCHILGFPRASLNVYASEKGCIGGLLVLRKNNERLKLNELENGLMINDSLLNVDHVESQANYILVVEKYSLYQKLCEKEIWNILPCILITGKGVPDFSTRKIICELVELFQLECVYVGDYDPYGFRIYLSYKEGCKTNEDDIFACTNMRWIGMNSQDIELIPKEALLPLSMRDKNVLRNMLNGHNLKCSAKVRTEITQMEKLSKKFEIEAMESLGTDFFIREYLIRRVMRREWAS